MFIFSLKPGCLEYSSSVWVIEKQGPGSFMIYHLNTNENTLAKFEVLENILPFYRRHSDVHTLQ